MTRTELTHEEVYDRWLRAEAELENVKKRKQQEIREARTQAEANTIRALLPLVDDIKRSVESAMAAKGKGALIGVREGVKIVADKAARTLEALGVEAVETTGRQFVADVMEAIAVTSAPGLPAGTVVTQVSGGYRRNGALLQAAQVIVAAKCDDNG